MFKTLQWEDWLGMAVGAWMLCSPWVLGYSGDAAATMNALFAGTFLVLVEMLDLDKHEDAEEWIDVAAGVWLVASPIVLNFGTMGAAALNATVVGLATIVLAVIALSPLDRRVAAWWHEGSAH